LALLSILVVSSIGFTEGKTEQNELDYYAEYTGEIVKSDRNFLLVNIVDTDAYVGIRILDKQGFVVDGDLIQGQLIRSAKSIVISDVTQGSKFVGKVERGETSWENICSWWDIRYEFGRM
jgi:hypothetical protein